MNLFFKSCVIIIKIHNSNTYYRIMPPKRTSPTVKSISPTSKSIIETRAQHRNSIAIGEQCAMPQPSIASIPIPIFSPKQPPTKKTKTILEKVYKIILYLY